MTKPGHSSRTFPTRDPARTHLNTAEVAAREMGGLSLEDALSLCELMANEDPTRYDRAAVRWLHRLIDERLPPLSEVALAASGLPSCGTEIEASASRR